MHKCPRCDGRGMIGPIHVNRGNKGCNWIDEMSCLICHGAGEVDDDTMQAIGMGKQLREVRISRDESLRECALRLGMTPSELSALEQGRGGLEAWRRPFATWAWMEVQQSKG